MVSSKHELKFTFEGPAIYRIVVQGALDATYATRLAGMSIENIQRDDGSSQVTLTGPLRDQAELRGVLDSLYGLHLPVISVEKIDGE